MIKKEKKMKEKEEKIDTRVEESTVIKTFLVLMLYLIKWHYVT